MSDNCRNALATEHQKEMLRFFGCTWDEGISAGQASDALEECARQFPDRQIEAEKWFQQLKEREEKRNKPTTADESLAPTISEFPPEPKRTDAKYLAWDNPAGQEYGFKRDHLRWQETVKKIKAEISVVPTSERLREKGEVPPSEMAMRKIETDTNSPAVADNPQTENLGIAAKLNRFFQERNHSQEVTIQEAAKSQNTSPSECSIPSRVVHDNPSSRKLEHEYTPNGFCKNCGWARSFIEETHRACMATQAGKSTTQEVTIQEAAKTQNTNPNEYTIPARDVQKYTPRHANQPVSMLVSVTPQRVDDLLKDCLLSNGCYWLPVTKAANLINNFDEAEKLTIDQSRLVAERLGSAGYCVEPDARFGGGSYGWNQTLGLFKSVESDSRNPSTAYLGAANLLRLCVLIALADGQIDEAELDVFREVIENQLDLSQTDHQRLQVLEKLLVKDSSSAAKTLAKAAKSIPAHKRVLIGKVLVRVAAADRVITKGERRALERIFKILEISPEALDNLIRQVCPPSQDAVSRDVGQSAGGEQIPKRFALDMAKVNSITNETKEVVGILSVVMQDEQEDPIRLPKIISAPGPEIPNISDDGKATSQPTRFSGLNSAFHPILERLLTRDAWPQTDFNSLAREFHFMPLNIRDTLNEWADEALGDFILEGEDPVVVRCELIAKEKNYG